MKDQKKLQVIVGKTVYSVHVSNAHGELIELTFTDGTKCNICSVVGTDQEDLVPLDDIYVSIDDVMI